MSTFSFYKLGRISPGIELLTVVLVYAAFTIDSEATISSHSESFPFGKGEESGVGPFHSLYRNCPTAPDSSVTALPQNDRLTCLV